MIMLEDAMRRLRETKQVRGAVDLYDSEERAERIAASARRGVR